MNTRCWWCSRREIILLFCFVSFVSFFGYFFFSLHFHNFFFFITYLRFSIFAAAHTFTTDVTLTTWVNGRLVTQCYGDETETEKNRENWRYFVESIFGFWLFNTKFVEFKMNWCDKLCKAANVLENKNKTKKNLWKCDKIRWTNARTYKLWQKKELIKCKVINVLVSIECDDAICQEKVSKVETYLTIISIC